MKEEYDLFEPSCNVVASSLFCLYSLVLIFSPLVCRWALLYTSVCSFLFCCCADGLIYLTMFFFFVKLITIYLLFKYFTNHKTSSTQLKTYRNYENENICLVYKNFNHTFDIILDCVSEYLNKHVSSLNYMAYFAPCVLHFNFLCTLSWFIYNASFLKVVYILILSI